jgi:hypothetical protein
MKKSLFLSVLLVFIAALAAQTPAQQPRAKAQIPQAQQRPISPFSLEAARQLFDLYAWDKAEEHFLKLESSASPADRQQALDGIKNSRKHIIEEKRSGSFAAARLLEALERWKDAEQAYVEIAKTDPEGAMLAAAEAERLKPKINNARWPEALDDLVLKLGHILLIPSIVYAVFRFWRAARRSRTSIKFQPFRASTDDAAKQLAFWLESTLANLRSPAPAFPTWPGLKSTLPLMRLPEIGDELELEDLEVGGVKVPLKQLIQSIAVPRARVSGHWYVGSATGSAYVSVEKRKWLGLRHASSAEQAVTSVGGPAQDADLRRFAYAVFIEASR